MATVIGILACGLILFFLIRLIVKVAKVPTAQAVPVKKSLIPITPTSNTPIDLSALCKVSIDSGDEGYLGRYYFLSDDEEERIDDFLYEKKPFTLSMLKKHPPVKIVYNSPDGTQPVYEIIPHGVDGHLVYDEDEEKPENCTSITISGIDLASNETQEFDAIRISSAWLKGEEINLGDYLAGLCRKSAEYKEKAQKPRQ